MRHILYSDVKLLCVLVTDEEQFQLITWSKDHTLRFWALDPRVVNVSTTSGYNYFEYCL